MLDISTQVKFSAFHELSMLSKKKCSAIFRTLKNINENH